jgi:hypothetical protein
MDMAASFQHFGLRAGLGADNETIFCPRGWPRRWREIAKKAAVQVPIELHQAARCLHYCLKPQAIRLERITINW